MDDNNFQIAGIKLSLQKTNTMRYELHADSASPELALILTLLAQKLYDQFDCECDMMDAEPDYKKLGEHYALSCRGLGINRFMMDEKSERFWLRDEDLPMLLNQLATQFPNKAALNKHIAAIDAKKLAEQESEAEFRDNLLYYDSEKPQGKPDREAEFSLGHMHIMLEEFLDKNPTKNKLKPPRYAISITGSTSDRHDAIRLIGHALAEKKLDCECYASIDVGDGEKDFLQAWDFLEHPKISSPETVDRQNNKKWYEHITSRLDSVIDMNDPTTLLVFPNFLYTKKLVQSGMKPATFRAISTALDELSEKYPYHQSDLHRGVMKIYDQQEEQTRIKSDHDQKISAIATRGKLARAVAPYRHAVLDFLKEEHIDSSEGLRPAIDEALQSAYQKQHRSALL